MKSEIDPFDDELDGDNLPIALTKEEKADALSKLNLKQDGTPLEKQVVVRRNNSAMLSDKKKRSTNEKVKALFQEQNFSPLTELVYLVKIERAKIEVYNKAVALGLDKRSLEAFPRPNLRFYSELLFKLVNYEVPTLKSVEVSGEIKTGMSVHVIHHAPVEKVVYMDEASPLKLREANAHGMKLAGVAQVLEAEIVEDDEI